MSIPSDLLTQAQEVGAEQDVLREATMITPQGKFSKNALNRLVKELNVVLQMFEQSYPEFEEDITVFPEDFVKMLDMVASAASDAGVDFELDMQSITDDRSLMMVAGQLRKLSKDKTFKKFLESNSIMGEDEPETEVVVEQEVVATPQDMDAMFAGRM
tara:strand:+ start:4255 stop:4728 length:474 start_codon:yes stop_codon:yes gene_type:complete